MWYQTKSRTPSPELKHEVHPCCIRRSFCIASAQEDRLAEGAEENQKPLPLEQTTLGMGQVLATS